MASLNCATPERPHRGFPPRDAGTPQVRSLAAATDLTGRRSRDARSLTAMFDASPHPRTLLAQSPRTILRKVRVRLWSTRRSITVVLELPPAIAAPGMVDLDVSFADPAAVPALTVLLPETTGPDLLTLAAIDAPARRGRGSSSSPVRPGAGRRALHPHRRGSPAARAGRARPVRPAGGGRGADGGALRRAGAARARGGGVDPAGGRRRARPARVSAGAGRDRRRERGLAAGVRRRRLPAGRDDAGRPAPARPPQLAVRRCHGPVAAPLRHGGGGRRGRARVPRSRRQDAGRPPAGSGSSATVSACPAARARTSKKSSVCTTAAYGSTAT